MHHYEPAERLAEIAHWVKGLNERVQGEVFDICFGPPPQVQLKCGKADETLVQLAETGHEHQLHQYEPSEYMPRTSWHLHVLVDGVWFWDGITEEQAERIKALQTKTDCAAVTA